MFRIFVLGSSQASVSPGVARLVLILLQEVEIKADVERGRGVGQGPDGNEVDSGRGDRCNGFQRYPT